MKILLDETGKLGIEKLIKQGVIDYNEPYLGLWNSKTFVFYIKDAEDKVIAGVCGHYLVGRHSEIELLWIEEKYRRQKIGSDLLTKAEEFLKGHKCPYVRLYTLEFQAKPFYEKRGYNLLGTIPGWGMENDAHFMRKVL